MYYEFCILDQRVNGFDGLKFHLYRYFRFPRMFVSGGGAAPVPEQEKKEDGIAFQWRDRRSWFEEESTAAAIREAIIRSGGGILSWQLKAKRRCWRGANRV